MTTTAIMAAAEEALRDDELFGIPGSGRADVDKAGLRAVLALIDVALSSLGVAGAVSLAAPTKALLDADLAHPADTLALVWNDAALSGVYAKTGATGAGGWVLTPVGLPVNFAADIAEVLSQTEVVVSGLTLLEPLVSALAAQASPAGVLVQDGDSLVIASKEDFRGDPGGTTDLIGTKAAVQAMSVGPEFGLIRLTGRANPGDGGTAATLKRVNAQPAAGGIQTLDGQWWAICPTPNGYDIEHFDAVLDGATDSAQAIRDAKAMALADGSRAIYCRPSDAGLYIASAVDLTGLRTIDFRSNVKVAPGLASPGLDLGGWSTGGVCDYRLRDVTDGTSLINAAPPAVPLVRLRGLKSSTMRIGSCNYLQLFGNNGAGAAYGSCAYNSLALDGVCSKFEITDDGNGGASWVNENHIHGGRILRLIVTGVGYFHNHNRFDRPTLEGANMTVAITKAWNTKVLDARIEGATASPGIILAADSWATEISRSWSSTGKPRSEFSIGCPVTDLGRGNNITTRSGVTFRKTTLLRISANQHLVASATESASPNPRLNPGPFGPFAAKAVLEPGLKAIRNTTPNRLIAMTGLIPTKLGDVLEWEGDYDGAAMRRIVYIYDADGAPILSDGGAGPYFAIPGVTDMYVTGTAGDQHGYYYDTSPVAVTAMVNPWSVDRPEVGFIRVAFYSDAAADFRFLGVSIRTQAIGRSKTELMASVDSLPLSLAGAPIKGFMPLGTSVHDRTAKVMWTCTLAHQTRTSAALATGAPTVSLVNVGTVANGDRCGILLDDGLTHWTELTGKSGSSFTIDPIPAGKSAAAGARLVVNRWEPDALVGRVTGFSPPGQVPGASWTTTVTVPGAKINDPVQVNFTNTTLGSSGLPWTLAARVSAADTVTVTGKNDNATNYSPGGGTLAVRVSKFG